jgi:hypothetical protein
VAKGFVVRNFWSGFESGRNFAQSIANRIERELPSEEVETQHSALERLRASFDGTAGAEIWGNQEGNYHFLDTNTPCDPKPRATEYQEADLPGVVVANSELEPTSFIDYSRFDSGAAYPWYNPSAGDSARLAVHRAGLLEQCISNLPSVGSFTGVCHLPPQRPVPKPNKPKLKRRRQSQWKPTGQKHRYVRRRYHPY